MIIMTIAELTGRCRQSPIVLGGEGESLGTKDALSIGPLDTHWRNVFINPVRYVYIYIYIFFFFGGGGHPKKLPLQGGPCEKNWRAERGSCNFLMVFPESHQPPLPHKKNERSLVCRLGACYKISFVVIRCKKIAHSYINLIINHWVTLRGKIGYSINFVTLNHLIGQWQDLDQTKSDWPLYHP